MEDYLNECIQKAFPKNWQQISQQYVRRKGCPIFVYQMEKWLAVCKSPLTQPPSSDLRPFFDTWLTKHFAQESQKLHLVKHFQQLQCHPLYLDWIQGRQCDMTPYRVVYQTLRPLKWIHFCNHIQALLAVTKDPCHLDAFLALEYCTASGRMTDVRMRILNAFGFGGMTQLKENIERRKAAQTRFAAWKEMIVKKDLHLTHYMAMLNALHLVDIGDLAGLTEVFIASALKTVSTNHHSVFVLLEKELLEANRQETVNFLKQELDFTFTLLTRYDKLCLLSPWHKAKIDSIRDTMLSNSKSSFCSSQKRKTLEIDIATYLLFYLSILQDTL